MDNVTSSPATIEPGTPLPDLEIQDILEILPHRYPMLLVDRIIDIKAFQSARGVKAVTFNEPYFPGHFPGDPIMPGVLIVEALAQTAAAMAVVSRDRRGQGDGVYFMSVDDARFKRPVRPGDLVHLDVEFDRQKMGVWRFKGQASVGGKLATSCTFAAKVFEGKG